MLPRLLLSRSPSLPRALPLALPSLPRRYRGASGDQESRLRPMSSKELELSAKSADLDSAIRANHTALPPAAAGIDALSARRKRLIYRAKQRGWLEVDLLLGTFAHREVPGMSEAEMDEFERLVNLETIDIYNILTLRAKPDEVDNGVVRRVVEWVETNPLGTASAEDYRKVKAEAGLT